MATEAANEQLTPEDDFLGREQARRKPKKHAGNDDSLYSP